MRSHPFIWLLLLMLTVPVQLLAATHDDKPEVSDIIITTSAHDLILFVTIRNCFTSEMITGVQNGIPLTFDFHIELEKQRNFWPDETLVSRVVHHHLTYDSLKEQYTVTLSEKQNRKIQTRSLLQAKKLMTEINGMPVIRRDRLIPDASYALRIKATLVKTTLPLGMHFLLPFTSLWNFETDWRSVEFRY